jgi:hypothetical protein
MSTWFTKQKIEVAETPSLPDSKKLFFQEHFQSKKRKRNAGEVESTKM